MSTLQGCELHLDVPRLILACAAAGVVYTTQACAASGHVYTLGPELHLDVFRLLVACASAGLVYTTGPVMHPDMSTHWPELHLDVSNPQGPVPTYC